MRSLLYLLTALAVIGLASWALTGENHLTQQAIEHHRAALGRGSPGWRKEIFHGPARGMGLFEPPRHLAALL